MDHEHVQLAVDVDQLDQRPVADATHQVVDVEPLGLLALACQLVVLGPDLALKPGTLLLQVLGRLTLDTRLGQPSRRVAQSRQ